MDSEFELTTAAGRLLVIIQITIYSLRPAGVLAFELLKQSYHPGSRTIFNRSSTIQNLSKLVYAIEHHVPQQHVNTTFCNHAKSALDMISTQVLDPPPGHLSAQSQRMKNGSQSVLSTSEWREDVTRSEPEFWDWLIQFASQTANEFRSS